MNIVTWISFYQSWGKNRKLSRFSLHPRAPTKWNAWDPHNFPYKLEKVTLFKSMDRPNGLFALKTTVPEIRHPNESTTLAPRFFD